MQEGAGLGKILSIQKGGKNVGSVKDLKVLSSPLDTSMGKGKFIFSDRYSVFDWGEMPDLIPQKGAALALIGAYFFELLEKEGFPTHYLGLEENGEAKKLDELTHSSSVMMVKLVRVILPPEREGIYDYGVYQGVQGNFLIPFEFIYRNSLPVNSSLRRRLEEGKVSLEELGLSRIPSSEENLPQPIIDVSTKLEEQDRYITWKEVLKTGILNEAEIASIKEWMREIDQCISREVGKIGLKNEDGKVELAFTPERELMVVDVVGTPDECRFTFQNYQMSKEIVREFYRKTKWYEEVKQAKEKSQIGWKGLVKEEPPRLPPQFLQLVSWLYQRIAIDLTEREWFTGVPSLSQIFQELSYFL